jgi:hypothetical protein
LSASEAIASTFEQINHVKIALASTGVGGGVTTANVITNEDGFLERLYSSGVDLAISGWTTQDTLTMIGFCLTAYGLYLTRETLKIRKKELRMKSRRRDDG